MKGFKASNGVIENVGGPPIMVRNIDADITIGGAGPIEATRLDEQGYAQGELKSRRNADSMTFTLPRDCLYTILSR